MKRFCTFIFISILTVIQAFTQDVNITADAPKVVEEGSLFHVRFSINTDPKNMFSVETCNEIQASGRPQTGSSSSVSIVNGQVTKSYQYTETRQFRATKKGTFPLPVASIKLDGKTYQSPSRTIEVVENGAAAQAAQQTRQQMQQNNQNQQVSPQDPKPESASSDIFARVFVNKSSAYVGEPILATIKLYSQKDIAGINDHSFPDFNGFFKRPLEQPQRLTGIDENINGEHYVSYLFQRVVIFPQKDGSLQISPFKVDCQVISGYSSGGFWGFPQRQIDRRVVESKPVTIKVKPLPAGKDANFTGAVGKFSISATSDVTTIPANEAFNLKITIKGEGNLSLVPKPVINFPNDFETYDPKVVDNYTITANGDKGSKTFEYVILPRREGLFTIPAVTMQYFDPSSQQYKTVQTDEIQISVSKGSNSGNVVSNFTTPNKEDVQFSNDIRFIKTGDLNLKLTNNFFFKSLIYWILITIIMLITFAVIILKRKQIELENDVTKLKNKRANKESQKRLKTAKQFLNQNEMALFYDEVAKALWGYVADKFSIDQVDLTTDKIKEILLAKQIEEQKIDKLLQVLHQCEFARFAPSSALNGEQVFDNASDVIQDFEQKK